MYLEGLDAITGSSCKFFRFDAISALRASIIELRLPYSDPLESVTLDLGISSLSSTMADAEHATRSALSVSLIPFPVSQLLQQICFANCRLRWCADITLNLKICSLTFMQPAFQIPTRLGIGVLDIVMQILDTDICGSVFKTTQITSSV